MEILQQNFYFYDVKLFKTIAEYCQAINISESKHPHFDIRKFEDNMPTVVNSMEAFRHEFYAIAIKAKGDGTVVAGHHNQFPEGATVFFNSPFQVTSWDIAPNWTGYYLMFTKEFITRSHHFNDLLSHFPFLKIEEAIPFEVDQKEVDDLLRIFEKVWAEYYGDNNDKFDMIEAWVILLLNFVKRSYHNQVEVAESDKIIKKADLKLLARYQALVESSFHQDSNIETFANLHSTSYYADKLNVHPNHLNAIVKSLTSQTASQIIYHHIILKAKELLSQTDHSIKEIAYQLYFDTPNNFSTFFKKHTQETPNSYRKSSIL